MAEFGQPNDNSERVLLRYHGGKARLADWICGFFPDHECYVEAFGGGASVLLAKERPESKHEIYNDVEHNVVNLMECLSCSIKAPALLAALKLTPYSREAWLRAWEEMEVEGEEGMVERARAFAARVMMSFGSKGTDHMGRVGFRAPEADVGYAEDWRNYVDNLPKIIARLRGVTIENLDALQLLRRMDAPRTLFYLDPPYIAERATSNLPYAHDFPEAKHEELLDLVNKMEGMVVLSGYRNPLYCRMLKGWYLEYRTNFTDKHSVREDCLWLNEAVADAHRGLVSPLSDKRRETGRMPLRGKG